MVNGKKSASNNIVISIGKKRTVSQALDDVSPLAKKAKNQSNGNGTEANEDLIVIDDTDDAILIDD